MSKERELLKRLLESNHFDSMLTGEWRYYIKELLAQPEEGLYQKLLSVEAGNEVAVLPSELWLDGYETGRKTPQKREPLSEAVIVKLFGDHTIAIHADSYWAGIEDAEKAHGIGE
jgi:hypothetical protein